ncbi:hypothetical protein PYCC9005_001468 [Savitreella phatthalungensis]
MEIIFQGQSMRLNEGESFHVYRASPPERRNRVVGDPTAWIFDNTTLSAVHATINLVDQDFVIFDEHSRHGGEVIHRANGKVERITTSSGVTLKDGDILKLGSDHVWQRNQKLKAVTGVVTIRAANSDMLSSSTRPGWNGGLSEDAAVRFTYGLTGSDAGDQYESTETKPSGRKPTEDAESYIATPSGSEISDENQELQESTDNSQSPTQRLNSSKAAIDKKAATKISSAEPGFAVNISKCQDSHRKSQTQPGYGVDTTDDVPNAKASVVQSAPHISANASTQHETPTSAKLDGIYKTNDNGDIISTIHTEADVINSRFDHIEDELEGMAIALSDLTKIFHGFGADQTCFHEGFSEAIDSLGEELCNMQEQWHERVHAGGLEQKLARAESERDAARKMLDRLALSMPTKRSLDETTACEAAYVSQEPQRKVQKTGQSIPTGKSLSWRQAATLFTGGFLVGTSAIIGGLATYGA